MAQREKDMVDRIPTRDAGKIHLRQSEIPSEDAQDFIPEGPVNDFFFMLTKEAR